MIFGLIPLRVWLALGAVAAAGLLLWGWGLHRYNTGVKNTTDKYEAAAAIQREVNAKATFRAVENTAKEVEAFTKVEVIRETVHVKDKAAVDAVWRYADRLRDELARRSAAPVEATSACATEHRRLRAAESIVGEYVEVVATCAGVAVEGRDLAQGLSNKLDLWKGYVKSLP
jgi:hypothetical protein